MADGLCSESDRKTFVVNLINENAVKTGGKFEKCVKIANVSSVASATNVSDAVETENRQLNSKLNMTGAKQIENRQQQPQKMSESKQSNNKCASTVAAMAASGNAIVANAAVNSNVADGVGNMVKSVRIEMIAPKVKNAVKGGASAQKSQQQQQKRFAKNGLAHVDMPGSGDSHLSITTATIPTTESGKKQQHQRPQETDDSSSGKKKRCSDRYDSSESSDSGVATLSCTDSSTTSSDASDPGSPYSPVSLGEDAHQSPKTNMPPQIIPITQNQRVQSQKQQESKQDQQQQKTTTQVQHQWPWNISLSNAISNHNNNIVNVSNRNSVNSVLNNSSKTKRSSANHQHQSDIHSTAKKIRTSTSAERLSAGLSATAVKRLKTQEESQTKITGYFKSQMKPLKAIKQDISNLIARTAEAQSAVLDKYFNVFAKTVTASGIKDDIRERKSFAIKKDFIDLPPLQAMSPSSKKLERKTTKIAQVAPMSRKTAHVAPQTHSQSKPPKKHIAIAPRIAESKAHQATGNFQTDQTKISQPTVLLTAIRIPPSQNAGGHGQTSQQPLTATVLPQATKGASMTPTKVGSMLQIPVVPNLVQIPNILTTANGTNLVMNNAQLARMGSGGPYFLNGALLKLQPISNNSAGSTNSTNGVLAKDSSALQGNLLLKPSAAIAPGMSTVTTPAISTKPSMTIPQPIVTQSSSSASTGNNMHQAFLTNQRLSTQSVLMATTAGWYVLNQPSHDTISNNIPHQTLPTMVCKSRAVTSLTNTHNPPVPPLVTLASKHELISTSTPKRLPPVSNTIVTDSLFSDFREKTTSGQTPETEKPLSVDCSAAIDSALDIPTTTTTTTTCTIKIDSPKTASTPKLSPAISLTAATIHPAAADVITPKCAISPILSQPKTIRFPVPSGCEAGSYRHGPKGIKRHDGVCYWDQCNDKYDTSSKLLDHLQTQHVNTQTGPFACLWSGCKVRGRESCSRRWLERHVLSHGGTKPFKCIVDGCGLRLGSQLALQKHVNSHFNATENKETPSKRTSDPPVPKQLRKNGKKLRYRRQPFSARMFDYFDAGIMEGLQHRLVIASSLTSGLKDSITFHGRTMARRKTSTGISEIYVKWMPNEIIPDEWIAETTKSALTKTITIQSMRYQERFALQKYLKDASLKSDISINAISTKTSSQLLMPSVTALLSSLPTSTMSSSSSSSTILSSSSSSSSSTSSSITDGNGETNASSDKSRDDNNRSTLRSGRKQYRKLPRIDLLQPS